MRIDVSRVIAGVVLSDHRLLECDAMDFCGRGVVITRCGFCIRPLGGLTSCEEKENGGTGTSE